LEEKRPVKRVRFAPSPTGYLHIGSARTAYFNWLFAKKASGSFILRIEDTDIARHIEESINSLTDSLKWLGLDPDEGYGAGGGLGPYRQSQRRDIYTHYAHRLLADKKAYRCFCTPQKLAQERQKSKKSEKTYKYDRHCLKLEDQEKIRLSKEVPYAIRIRLPDDYDIRFFDGVYGKISVNTKQLDDFIILRSNGLPTYNFSAALDDALMEITDVIRGEDHLSNTPKQIIILELLDFPIPAFTHLPMILGQDGQKLSKRHGSVSIEEYRKQGILPEAILNYLALLGWAYSEDQDVFSIREAVDRFCLSDINKKPARFDYQKLLWLNGAYIRKMDQKRLAEMVSTQVRETLDKENLLKDWDRDFDQKIIRIVPLVRERIKTVSEVINWVAPFFSKLDYSSQAITFFDKKKIDAPKVLKKTIEILEEKEDFQSQNIENTLRKTAEDMGLSLRNYTLVLRMALWGSKVSPPLFDTISILGKDLTLSRLKDYLKRIGSKA